MENIRSFTVTDRVNLVNGRIVDLAKGCYFGFQVSMIIQNGKIMAMLGLPGEPDGLPIY